MWIHIGVMVYAILIGVFVAWSDNFLAKNEKELDIYERYTNIKKAEKRKSKNEKTGHCKSKKDLRR